MTTASKWVFVSKADPMVPPYGSLIRNLYEPTITPSYNTDNTTIHKPALQIPSKQVGSRIVSAGIPLLGHSAFASSLVMLTPWLWTLHKDLNRRQNCCRILKYSALNNFCFQVLLQETALKQQRRKKKILMEDLSRKLSQV